MLNLMKPNLISFLILIKIFNKNKPIKNIKKIIKNYKIYKHFMIKIKKKLV